MEEGSELQPKQHRIEWKKRDPSVGVPNLSKLGTQLTVTEMQAGTATIDSKMVLGAPTSFVSLVVSPYNT